MKKILTSLSFLFVFSNIHAQVGIGTPIPNVSAQLDITSTNKGFLMPRMTQAQRDEITSPATGLLIYQTDNDPGFYAYNGANWQQLGVSGWRLGGNNVSNADFIGTTNNEPLRFRVNNENSGLIDPFSGNVGLGYWALHNTPSGNLSARHNIAFGYAALYNNTNGSGNNAIGAFALISNITGNDNVANGSNTLRSNEGGNGNIGIGANALFNNTTGNYNVANGYQALENNTNGIGNTAIGRNALFSNTTGNYNVANGYEALNINTTGDFNTAIGTNALSNNSIGSYNIAIGYQATSLYNNLNNAIAIGKEAQVDCSNCMVLGSIYGVNGANSSVNVGIGTTNPTLPLSFGNTGGGKISFYNSGNNTHYGIGLQGGLLQIYTDASEADIAFGYGNSNSFTQTMRIKGNGNAILAGTLTQNSDARLKRDIKPITNASNTISQIKGYTYYWKDTNRDSSLQTGIIAQEVQKVLPELVKADEKGLLSVNYSGLIPLLIEATKEQQQVISYQNKENEMLRKDIEALKKGNSQLEQQMEHIKQTEKALGEKLAQLEAALKKQ